MPPRRRDRDIDEEEEDEDFLDDDIESDSEYSDSDCDDNNDPAEDIRSKMESMDNHVFLTVFKNAMCNAMLDVASGSVRSCKKRKRQEVAGGSNADILAKSRFNVKYFSGLISMLNEHKKTVIRSYGFGSILDFDKCHVPMPFARWIAEHVKVNLEDIVVNNRSIKLSAKSVHDVLGIPLGGRDILRDPNLGKRAFLSMMNMKKGGSVKEFGDKLIKNDLEDDDVVRCFLVVALAYFLCPSSCVAISPYYLPPLFDVKQVKEWNWCKLVHDWLLKKIAGFQKRLKDGSHSSAAMGGCIYYLSVVYLDHLDFATKPVPPPTIPRIGVWKGDMIKEFSRIDRSRRSKSVFGERPIKPYRETCYYRSEDEDGFGVDESLGADPLNVVGGGVDTFKSSLDNLVNNSLCPEVLNGVAELYSRHSRGLECRQQNIVQDVIKDVIKYLYDFSRREKSFDTSQRRQEDPCSSKNFHFDVFESNFRPRHGEDNNVDFDMDVNNRDMGADVDGDANANTSGDTELLPSEGNLSGSGHSGGGTVDTEIIASSGRTHSQDLGDDVRRDEGVVDKRKTRFAAEVVIGSIDSGVRKRKRSTSSAEIAPNSQSSVGTRTRSQADGNIGFPCLEDVLKRNRKRRLVVRKKRTPTPSGSVIHELDDDDVEGAVIGHDKAESLVGDVGHKDGSAAHVGVQGVTKGPNSTDLHDGEGAEIGHDKAESLVGDVGQKVGNAVHVGVEAGTKEAGANSADPHDGEGAEIGHDKAESLVGDEEGRNDGNATYVGVEAGTKEANSADPHDGEEYARGYCDDSGFSKARDFGFDDSAHFNTTPGPAVFDESPGFAAFESRGPIQFDATVGPSEFSGMSFSEDAGCTDIEIYARPLAMIPPGCGDPINLMSDFDSVEDLTTPARDMSPDVVIIGARSSSDGGFGSNYDRCKKMNFDHSSTSDSKMPRTRARRVTKPCSYFRDFETGSCKTNFYVPFKERLFFNSVIQHGSDPNYKD